MVCPHDDCLAKSEGDQRLQQVSDGVVHFAMWLTVIAGIALLLSAALKRGHAPASSSHESPDVAAAEGGSDWTWRGFAGSLLMGSDWFRVV